MEQEDKIARGEEKVEEIVNRKEMELKVIPLLQTWRKQ